MLQDVLRTLIETVRGSSTTESVGESPSPERPRSITPDGGTAVVDDDVVVADSDGTSIFDASVESVVESLLRGVSEPAYIVDADGTITHTNEGCRALYGHDPGDAVGVNVFGYGEAHNEVLRDVLEDGERIENREETIEAAETTVPISRTIWPLYDDVGDVVGAFEIDRDVSERIELERREESLEAYQNTVVAELKEYLARLSEGDLTIDPGVPEPDAEFDAIESVHEQFASMASDLGVAVQDFRTTLLDVRRQVEELSQASERLAAQSTDVSGTVETVQQVSERTRTTADEQLDRSEDAEATISDLSATIEEIASETTSISTLGNTAQDEIDDATDEAHDALDRMQVAVEASRRDVEQMKTLTERIEDVLEMTEAVADVAQQTDILALNANIEAARADASGSGFKVVADEVRELATQSGDIVSRIDETVSELEADSGQRPRASRPATSVSRTEPVPSRLSSIG